MELDNVEKKAVRELGEAINASIEKSPQVAEAIENLRELGFEPNLLIKLEIGLQEADDFFDEFEKDVELDLTDEDLRTLRSMKINIDE